MSAPYIIPFNFQPTNIVAGTTAAYTVPSGFYAIVKVSMTATAHASHPEVGAGASGSQVSTDSSEKCFELILMDGDQITSSLSNASGTFATGASATEMASATTTATVSVNATAIAVCKAVVGATANTSASTTITFSGESHVGYVAAEYPVIS